MIYHDESHEPAFIETSHDGPGLRRPLRLRIRPGMNSLALLAQADDETRRAVLEVTQVCDATMGR